MNLQDEDVVLLLAAVGAAILFTIAVGLIFKALGLF